VDSFKKEVKMSVYSFGWLVEAMRTRKEIILVNHDCKPIKGLVNGIRPEDGSGKNWLVTICSVGSEAKEVFVHAS
jgi:hypothetical protein